MRGKANTDERKSASSPIASNSNSPMSLVSTSPSNKSSAINTARSLSNTSSPKMGSSSALFENSAALQALAVRMKSTKASSLLLKAREEKKIDLSRDKQDTERSMPIDTEHNVKGLDKGGKSTFAAENAGSDLVGVEKVNIIDADSKVEKKGKRRDSAKVDSETPSSALPSPKRKAANRSISPNTDAEDATIPSALEAATKSRPKKPKISSAMPSKVAPIPSGSAQPARASLGKIVKKAGKKAKSSAAAKTAAKVPDIPDFDSWDKATLQAETGKYGYKPAGTKKVLVAQLLQVWHAIHPGAAKKMEATAQTVVSREESSDAETNSSSTSSTSSQRKANLAPWKARPRSVARSRTPTELLSDSEDTNPLSAAVSKKGASSPKKTTKKMNVSDKQDKEDKRKKKKAERKAAMAETDIDAGEIMTAGERLREQILKDEPFYLRLLRYEVRILFEYCNTLVFNFSDRNLQPICFTHFEELATKADIQISKVSLRDWLDSQAIIFCEFLLFFAFSRNL